MTRKVLLSDRKPSIGQAVEIVDVNGSIAIYQRVTEDHYRMIDHSNGDEFDDNAPLVYWIEHYTEELNAIAHVREFHETFNHPILPKPTFPAADRTKLRVSLIQEELNELKDAIEVQDLVEVADALCDLQYVLSGAILEFGMADKFPELFAEVHRSNMSKACKNNEEVMETEKSYLKQGVVTYSELVGNRMVVKRMSDQKILKNINYSSANLKKILQ